VDEKDILPPEEIPLPEDDFIPLPDDEDEDIPLPEGDIPLPSDDDKIEHKISTRTSISTSTTPLVDAVTPIEVVKAIPPAPAWRDRGVPTALSPTSVSSSPRKAVDVTTPSSVKKYRPPKRVRHYIQWIASMKIWEKIEVDNFYSQFRSGLLLVSMLLHIVPDLEFRGLYGKAVVKGTSLSNIEKALEVIWKRKVLTSNMPSAEKVYMGETFWIDGLMHEIMSAFVMVEVRKNMDKTMQWLNKVLNLYGAPLSMDPSILWQELASGTRLLCILHYYACSLDDSGILVDTRCIW
jgi:hypothetical protein